MPRTPLALCLFLTLVLLPASGRAEKQAVLLLQWLPQSQFAGFYVAQDKGFYREAGVDLTVRAGGPDILASRELARGAVEFATMFLATGIQRQSEGMPWCTWPSWSSARPSCSWPGAIPACASPRTWTAAG